MLRGFTEYLITDAIVSMLKAIPALVMLTLAIWLIAGMLLSCGAGMRYEIAQDYYICSNAICSNAKEVIE